MALRFIIILFIIFLANPAYAQTLPEYDIVKTCQLSVGLGEGIYSSREEKCRKDETEAKARLSRILTDNTSVSPARRECCLKFNYCCYRPIIVAQTNADSSFVSKETPASKPLLGSYVFLETCLLNDNQIMLCSWVPNEHRPR